MNPWLPSCDPAIVYHAIGDGLTLRIPFDELHATLRRVLQRSGFTGERADLCARLFAESSRDGVSSHGLNRFPRFMQMIRSGVVDVRAQFTSRARRG